MLHIEPGFSRPEHVQTVRIGIPQTEVAEPERVLQMQREMVDRLAAIPGVASVSFTTALPMETEPDFESGTAVSVAALLSTVKGKAGSSPPSRNSWAFPVRQSESQRRMGWRLDLRAAA